MILSLFDGASVAQQAIKDLGIPFTTYYASEIDKYAIQVTQKNHPNTIQLGDVTKWQSWDIPWHKIKLIAAGSPCQGFSVAGKMLNFEDYRSKLFFDFVKILNYVKKCNPNVKFLLENVRMKKEWQQVICEAVKTPAIHINSALLSAQSRPRVYWANFPIWQPADRGIMLKDILLDCVDEKYFIKSEKHLNYLSRHISNGYLAAGQIAVDPVKAVCMTTRQYASWRGTFVTGSAIRGRYKDGDIQQVLELRQDEKANALTSVTKTSLVAGGLIQLGYIGDKDVQGARVYSIDGKSVSLCANGGGWGARTGLYIIKEDPLFFIRRLSPVECARLQTMPDDYADNISDAQAYKLWGNSFTKEVIVHILKGANL